MFSHDLGDTEAPLAQLDGRVQDGRHIKLAAAEALYRVHPASRGAGNGDGMGAVKGDFADSAFWDAEVPADRVERALCPGATRTVQRLDLVGGSVPEEDKHVAADAR